MLEVIEHLEDLATSEVEPQDREEGICDELKYYFGGDLAHKVMAKMKEWPEHSGDELFPVPCPFNSPPKNRYNRTKDLWMRKYGDKRKELCAWLALELRNEL